MKPESPALSSPYLTVPRTVPTHEEIAVEAEVLWRQRGCPVGRDAEIWLEAERVLHHLPQLPKDENDQIALKDPLSRMGVDSDEVMEELEELFPGGNGDVSTSL